MAVVALWCSWGAYLHSRIFLKHELCQIPSLTSMLPLNIEVCPESSKSLAITVNHQKTRFLYSKNNLKDEKLSSCV